MDVATCFTRMVMLMVYKVYYVLDCPVGQFYFSDPDGGYCRPCGHCIGGTCDNSGLCPGNPVKNYILCADGWKPPLCLEPCGGGTWGADCKQKCKFCDGPCNKVNGSCKVCLPGYRPDTGFCDTPCDDGDFGSNCKSRCGFCGNDQLCNKTTGACPAFCKHGFKIPFCSDVCNKGTYGENCAKTCGHCGNDATCNNVDGRCQVCAPGFQPPFCTEECHNGVYGANCRDICGSCANNAPCNKRTGHCPGSCQGTVLPPLCKGGCKRGYFGENCDRQCGQCAYFPCDKTTGKCQCPADPDSNATSPGQPTCVVCLSGYKPPLCQSRQEESKLSKQTLGLWIGLGLFMLVVVAITFFIVVRTVLKRRRAKREAILGLGPRRSVRFSVATPPPTAASLSGSSETSEGSEMSGVPSSADSGVDGSSYGTETPSSFYSGAGYR